jgi:Immunity protein 21
MKLNWINSSGGPLVCCGTSLARKWRGTNGSSADDSASDYDRACEVNDYIGIADSADQSVLILGDEPLMSCFYMSSSGLLVLRWVSCSVKNNIEEIISTLPLKLPIIELSKILEIKDDNLQIFDASSCIDEGAPTLHAKIIPGLYEITVEEFKLDGSYEFLVHRFISKS